MPSMLDTDISIRDYLRNSKYRVTIDGHEYTAITDKAYDFKTTSPSRIVQRGFEYTKFSIVQPCIITYSIVVSKIDTTEYERLKDLATSRRRFRLSNSVYTIENCVIASISIQDDSFDTLTLEVTIQEINTSLMFAAEDASTIFQMFPNIISDGSATEATENKPLQLKLQTINIPGGNTTVMDENFYNGTLSLVDKEQQENTNAAYLGNDTYAYPNVYDEWVLSSARKDFLKYILTTPLTTTGGKGESYSTKWNEIYTEYKSLAYESYQSDYEFISNLD